MSQLQACSQYRHPLRQGFLKRPHPWKKVRASRVLGVVARASSSAPGIAMASRAGCTRPCTEATAKARTAVTLKSISESLVEGRGQVLTDGEFPSNNHRLYALLCLSTCSEGQLLPGMRSPGRTSEGSESSVEENGSGRPSCCWHTGRGERDDIPPSRRVETAQCMTMCALCCSHVHESEQKSAGSDKVDQKRRDVVDGHSLGVEIRHRCRDARRINVESYTLKRLLHIPQEQPAAHERIQVCGPCED